MESLLQVRGVRGGPRAGSAKAQPEESCCGRQGNSLGACEDLAGVQAAEKPLSPGRKEDFVNLGEGRGQRIFFSLITSPHCGHR